MKVIRKITFSPHTEIQISNFLKTQNSRKKKKQTTQNNEKKKQQKTCSINHCTSSSDLPIRPGFDSDPSHFFHGLRELIKELLLRSSGEASDLSQRLRIHSQRRVRLKKPTAFQDEPVIAKIEGVSTTGIHFDLRGIVGER